MSSLLFRLVILITFLTHCDPDLPAIERRLKEDKSRPGKVGTLRALEVVSTASRISSRPCRPAIDLDFRGEFKTELSIHLHRRNGESFRRLNEKRVLSTNEKITQITTEKHTVDELGIVHDSKRTWIFDGEKTVITTTLGHGEISGPRKPRSDEKEKIFAAALSSFRAFRAFSDPTCVSVENESLDKNLDEITIDKKEISDDKVILNWRAMSEGRLIEVKYRHEKIVRAIEMEMPSVSYDLKAQSSGFESARRLIEELKKEKIIQ